MVVRGALVEVRDIEKGRWRAANFAGNCAGSGVPPVKSRECRKLGGDVRTHGFALIPVDVTRRHFMRSAPDAATIQAGHQSGPSVAKHWPAIPGGAAT